MKKILFIGMPGSGKGTQAQRLTVYGLVHISTGDIIREAFARQDPLILPFEEAVNAGHFLPDNLIFNLIEKKVSKVSISKLSNYKGYILDGAVRNIAQAKQALEDKIVDEVFYFHLPEKVAIDRVYKRKNLEGRQDDSPQVVKKRFEIYKQHTQPILDYLKSHVKKYHEIDASPPIDQISKEVVKILKLKDVY